MSKHQGTKMFYPNIEISIKIHGAVDIITYGGILAGRI